MTTTKRVVRLSLLICFAAALHSGYVLSAAAAADAVGVEELWLGNPVITDGEKLTFVLHYPETASLGETIPLAFEIVTTIPFEQTSIRLTMENQDSAIVQESEITTDLRPGRNDLTINWVPTDLEPGRYALLVSVDYADSFSPARYLLPVNRVSAAHWKEEVDTLKPILAELEKGITSLVSEANGEERSAGTSDSSRNTTSLQVRSKITAGALTEAEQAIAQGNWRLADRNLTYAREAIKVLRAEITFINILPEKLLDHIPYPERVSIHDGGIFENDKPLFLMGAVLDSEPSANTDTTGSPLSLVYGGAATLGEQTEWLKNHGLNFAVLKLPANRDISILKEEVSALARVTGELRIPWVMQLEQAAVEGPMMDTWPELLESGFVNLAHDGFSSYYLHLMEDLVSMAGAQPYPPAGASIAWGPQFKYDGEPVRQQFVASVKERYPDRIDLNRLWRSHLADHDEITIWGEYPEHSYQNQRTYQFEWQTFHRGLITNFFAAIKQELAAVAPNVPVMITLPDSPFLPGETRNSPSREDMAGMMDIHGSSAHFEAGQGMYAMNYPYPHATIALMRSYARQKPVFVLNGDIDVASLSDNNLREKFVRSVVWEAVMSGVTGMALSPDSSIFQHPEALAAYALAAMEINRLAPIIMAFQQAPAEIAILFSEASKIMDDGVPHLESAQFAFEGASFAGFPVRFLTNSKIKTNGLEGVKVLILPNTMAVPDDTFEHVAQYVEDGGMVARVGTPIPYNEKGHSRTDVIRATANTILVRGMNLPTEYLHALDAALVGGVLPETARPLNAHGYPLEGVRSRCVRFDGETYLYIINLQRNPVSVYLSGLARHGHDVIRGSDVQFPREMPPLEPMLIRLEKSETVFTVSN